MKILHVGPVRTGLVAVGPTESIRGLASAQTQIGLDIGLLSSIPLAQGAPIEESSGVYCLGGLDKKHYNPWFISNNLPDRIKKEFGEPDVVHFHSVYDPFQIALARRCRQLGWPYIITPRGGMGYVVQNVKGTKKGIANLLCFRSYVKHAVAIHALSPGEADEIRASFETQKIIIVPNGVADYLFESSEKLCAADLGDFRRECDLMLGFVGRIYVYIKGLDLLLKAMAILKSLHGGLRCKLFLVGPFYTKRDERWFCSAVESLGLEGDVKLFGPKYCEEKWSYFLACDVFVHTSRSEGMPMAVLEAMALGRPCLVTPGTRVGDIVREAGGWECKTDPKSIAETIKSIYEKKDSLEALGQRSQELIQRRFTWRRVAEQLSKEYAKIIK